MVVAETTGYRRSLRGDEPSWCVRARDMPAAKIVKLRVLYTFVDLGLKDWRRNGMVLAVRVSPKDM